MAKEKKTDRPAAVEVFLTKVEAIAENVHSTQRRELLIAAKICRAELRKRDYFPWSA